MKSLSSWVVIVRSIARASLRPLFGSVATTRIPALSLSIAIRLPSASSTGVPGRKLCLTAQVSGLSSGLSSGFSSGFFGFSASSFRFASSSLSWA